MRRFITDFRYVERAQRELSGFEAEQGPIGEIGGALRDGWPAGAMRLGFDDGDLTVRAFERLRELVPDRIELVAAGGLVEDERAVKDAGRARADRRRRGAGRRDASSGSRDFGLVGAPSARWRWRSSTRCACAEPRTRASRRSWRRASTAPRRTPTPATTPIPADTLVTLDLGCRVDGYCSDCTRTWATGALSDELAAIYALVLDAQETALAAVRPGPTGQEVDAVARAIIERAGHGEHFGHGLGHGVGLEVHEAPRLGRQNDTPLVPGNVVTVEPGVYVPGVGGVRIEDLVVVTPAGHEVLSATPKALRTVG